jgi:hypothetical protein
VLHYRELPLAAQKAREHQAAVSFRGRFLCTQLLFVYAYKLGRVFPFRSRLKSCRTKGRTGHLTCPLSSLDRKCIISFILLL